MVTIAVDCDDVLTETVPSLIEHVKVTYSRHRVYDDIHDYMLSNNAHMSITHEEAVEAFATYFESHYAKESAHVDGAYEKLMQRKEAGHRMIVVTARNEQTIDITNHQLEKHYPGIFDGVVYASHYTDKHVSKSELCSKIGADYLIDDNMNYALEVAACGMKAYVLERPRNRHRKEEHPNITRVKHRSEIVIPQP